MRIELNHLLKIKSLKNKHPKHNYYTVQIKKINNKKILHY